jgi:cellulose synthase/poly-beta-1,6-N-acetylglucosamine synthase-like glycosyltransferase
VNELIHGLIMMVIMRRPLAPLLFPGGLPFGGLQMITLSYAFRGAALPAATQLPPCEHAHVVVVKSRRARWSVGRLFSYLVTYTPRRRALGCTPSRVPLSLGEVFIIARINLEKAPWRAIFLLFFFMLYLGERFLSVFLPFSVNLHRLGIFLCACVHVGITSWALQSCG